MALSGSFGMGWDGDDGIKIQYISSEMIYLDKGKNIGIDVGDILYVMTGSVRKATLEVVSIAARSASCKVLNKTEDLKVGDRVALGEKAVISKEQEVVPEPEPVNADSPGEKPERKVVQRRRGSPISGTLSLQYFSFLDESGYGRDFQQPGLRLNLKGKNLLGGNYGFRIKTRVRYNQREQAVNSRVPDTEWKNRIYEASFYYDNPNALFNYKVGRLISDKFSGVGYIDGAQLQAGLSKRSKLGVFAGSQPEWQSSDLNTSLTKYGAYYDFQTGDYQSSLFQSTIAVAGEYHGSTVNREFAYIRNRFSLANRLTLYQSAEIEINRDWRKEKTGEDYAVTNLHIYGRFQLTDKVKLGLSFDNRQNYYTYELRNRDELYFDETARRGFKADFSVKFTNDLRLTGNYGFREREGEDEEATYYFANLYKRNFIGKGWSFNLRANGFENPHTEGFNPSVRVGKRFGSVGNTLYFGYSNYDYTYLATDTTRQTQWFQMEVYWVLNRKLFLSGQYEYNLGDDAEGHRIYLELGYRF